jgi:hypothetical protein
MCFGINIYVWLFRNSHNVLKIYLSWMQIGLINILILINLILIIYVFIRSYIDKKENNKVHNDSSLVSNRRKINFE